MSKCAYSSLASLLMWSLLGAPVVGKAAHIIGGEMTYACLGEVTAGLQRYRVTVVMYRDCAGGGADFDGGPRTSTDFEMTVFLGDAQVSTGVIPRENLTIESVGTFGSSGRCGDESPAVCIERGTYVTEIALPVSTQTYTFSYQRCCRPETLSNLMRPGDVGTTYTVEIGAAAQRTCNSSPVYDRPPPTAVCVDEDFAFDAAATDPDGDRLVYSVCAPYVGGGNITRGTAATGFNGVTPNPESPPPYEPAAFRSGFRPDQPFDGEFAVDSLTGRITAHPRAIGRYAACLRVREYREGVLLGEVRREIEFNVTSCAPITPEPCLLDADNSWSVSEETAAGAQDVLYAVGRDSVDGGRTYRVITRSVAGSGRVEDAGVLLRQAGRSIWRRAYGQSVDRRLYDFSLGLGDEFILSYTQVDTTTTVDELFTVLAVDSVDLNDGRRVRRLGLGCPNGDTPDRTVEYWIEGVGSSRGLFPSTEVCPRDFRQGLLCFRSGPGILYPSNPPTCLTVGVEEAAAAGIAVFPNPIGDILRVRDADAALDGYSLLDALGREVATGRLTGGGAAIGTAHLPGGVYVLLLREGGVLRYAQRLTRP